ncbi:MAG: hypothetical protein HY040_04250 [Planctomycetes bacterium]|nr:hypothetical protein [Planctomycetota bacterium]
MADHLRVDCYGNFRLTDAIRPAIDRKIVPQQGYRIEIYRDAKAGFQVPVLVASVSSEKLFDVFLDLLDPLGELIDVVLETSHDSKRSQHLDLFREHIDLPILKSHCCEFEDLLLNDGCTGLAALSTTEPIEVQFDEHKLFIVYAADMKPFTAILAEHGIVRDDRMKLITEGEHLHSTDQRFRGEFEQLCFRLGVGEAVERVNW